MGDMAQTVSHSALKVAAMCVTETLGIVTARLVGMGPAVTQNVAIDV